MRIKPSETLRIKMEHTRYNTHTHKYYQWHTGIKDIIFDIKLLDALWLAYDKSGSTKGNYSKEYLQPRGWRLDLDH